MRIKALQISIYVSINNTNNYIKLISNDHVLTYMLVTLETSQDATSLLNTDAPSNIR